MQCFSPQRWINGKPIARRDKHVDSTITFSLCGRPVIITAACVSPRVQGYFIHVYVILSAIHHKSSATIQPYSRQQQPQTVLNKPDELSQSPLPAPTLRRWTGLVTCTVIAPDSLPTTSLHSYTSCNTPDHCMLLKSCKSHLEISNLI